MRRISLLCFVVGVTGASLALLPGIHFAAAQSDSRADAHPAFEAATLKPSGAEGNLILFPHRSGDRFTWNNTFLSMMVAYAYSMPSTRIEGLHVDGYYSVAAKMDTAATDAQARLMLQALLEERLKMMVRRETRQMQGYELVIAKGGTKLKGADLSADPPPMPGVLRTEPATAMRGEIFTFSIDKTARNIVARGITMQQLADELSKTVAAPVADRTGLTGKYYFDVAFQPETTAGAPAAEMNDDLPTAPSIFSALPERLGLRLEKAKVPAEYLVVEHAEKPAEE